MPTSNFPEYIQTVTNILDSIVSTGQAKIIDLKVDQRSSLRGLISGSVLFEDDSELRFREFVDVSLNEPKLAFAFHYHNSEKKLIFRYDNAMHRPPLSESAHKHRPDGIILSPPPTLAQVIDEILNRKMERT